MALLQMELSQLEVELLEILADVPTPEQNSDLETLTSNKGEVDLTGVLTVKGTLPVNNGSCSCSCSCSCG